MPDILHRVGMNTSPSKIFKELSTVDGLCHWRMTETSGNANRGGKVDVGFCDMKVMEYTTNKFIKWKCS